MISNALRILKQTRTNIHQLVSGYSLEQITRIPEGFNNNLIWNYGHVLVTQQLLCYKLSGNTPAIPDSIIDRYRKGTFPNHPNAGADLELFNQMCFEQVNQLEDDINQGLFANYNRYQTSFGLELTSIEDAILFNNSHEAMHFGAMLMIKKFI